MSSPFIQHTRPLAAPTRGPDDFEAEEVPPENATVGYIQKTKGDRAAAPAASTQTQAALAQPPTPMRGASYHAVDVEDRSQSSDHDVLSEESETSEDPSTEEAHAVYSSPNPNVVPQARSIDPVNASEVMAGGRGDERMQDRLERLEKQNSKKMRFQACTFAALGFSMGVAITSIVLLFVILGDSTIIRSTTPQPSSVRRTSSPTVVPSTGPTNRPGTPQPVDPSATTPVPTTETPTISPSLKPSASPSSPAPTTTVVPTTTLENEWTSLIQSRSNFTTFDIGSPQRQALDWMMEDPFSLSLTDDIQIVERFVLMVIYFSTGGPTTWNLKWENSTSDWLNSTSVCEWGDLDDVECNDQGLVDRFDVSNEGLSGRLPREIGLLTNLDYLHIFSSDISGTIPTEVGLLTSLTYLSLSRNSLGGTIPTELGLLSSLTELNLFKTMIEGTVPTEFSSMKNLTSGNFHGNKLEGAIPSEVGLFSMMEYFSLWKNELDSTIPTEVGQLTALTYWSWAGNKLRGTLPSEIGLMTSLTTISLRGNRDLSGMIPTEMAELTNLEIMHVSDTNVMGSIPSSLCDGFVEAHVICVQVDCGCCNSSTNVPCSDVLA